MDVQFERCSLPPTVLHRFRRTWAAPKKRHSAGVARLNVCLNNARTLLHGNLEQITFTDPSTAVPQDDFGGGEEMPEAVTALGGLPLAALAALALHLRRLRSVEELAGYAALVSPYEVRTDLRTALHSAMVD